MESFLLVLSVMLKTVRKLAREYSYLRKWWG
jgi:hypothetical protein